MNKKGSPMSQKSNYFKGQIDYAVVIPVFFLLMIGLASIYVATMNDYPSNIYIAMFQQVSWIIMGCIIAFVVMLFSTEFLWKATPYLYALGLTLMVLPLIFYSPQLFEATGAKNWVTIGSVTLFQPSEFMKISYILMLSRITVSFHQKNRKTFQDDWKLLGLFGLVTLPVMILLMLQKDLGTALVFLAILSGLILLSGISWWIILPILSTIVLFIASFLMIFISPNGKEWFYNLGMDTYQINRLSAWIDPFSFADSIAYQQTQGMVSIGSGGLTGKGFNILELSVPVRESDMIFTVIAENFGFIGSAIVLGLYLIIIYRMLRITIESNNQFYTFISTGFIMMIVFHVFENIGAAVGILPLTGIPLPFISQGGSSLLSNLIGIGLVLSMSYQNTVRQAKANGSHLKYRSI